MHIRQIRLPVEATDQHDFLAGAFDTWVFDYQKKWLGSSEPASVEICAQIPATAGPTNLPVAILYPHTELIIFPDYTQLRDALPESAKQIWRDALYNILNAMTPVTTVVEGRVMTDSAGNQQFTWWATVFEKNTAATTVYVSEEELLRAIGEPVSVAEGTKVRQSLRTYVSAVKARS